MSFMGSPYSNNYAHDDYEFEDDHYNDDFENRENEDPRDETDEDTEDASETDTGRREEPLEMKEHIYQVQLAGFKKKLQQLKDGVHQDFNKRCKRLEMQYKERLRVNAIYRDYMIECVDRDYVNEKRAAAKEFEDKKIDLRENLLSDFEDKKKTIEAERYSMELTGDSTEVKPVMTRKLRRRPNDPVPVPEKRRKAPSAQIVYVLDDKEVEHDLKLINRGKTLTPIRKPVDVSRDLNLSNNTISQHTPQLTVIPPSISDTRADTSSLVETRVEDGKLSYERRWFHRGQSVYVEGRDMPKFPASISAITTDIIWVKKATDCSKVKIYVNSLARGKISIKRRAS